MFIFNTSFSSYVDIESLYLYNKIKNKKKIVIMLMHTIIYKEINVLFSDLNLGGSEAKSY